MAASMLRGVAASALRRRSSSLWRAVPKSGGAPFQPRWLRTSAASPPLPAPPAAASTAFRHHLSSTANNNGGGVMESERRKAVDEAKAEVFRHMMRDDAAAGGGRQTPDGGASKIEELVGFISPASADGIRDKHLMLTLLVRSARAEEKLSEETRRVELLLEHMAFTLVRVFRLLLTVFVGLPVLGLLCLIAKWLWRVLLAVFAPADRTKETK